MSDSTTPALDCHPATPDEWAPMAAAARTDIVRTLRHHFDSEGDTPERSHARAEALVAYYDEWHRRAHAHELAEKIRAEGEEAVGGAWDGYMRAADLIDPEAQR